MSETVTNRSDLLGPNYTYSIFMKTKLLIPPGNCILEDSLVKLWVSKESK